MKPPPGAVNEYVLERRAAKSHRGDAAGKGLQQLRKQAMPDGLLQPHTAIDDLSQHQKPQRDLGG